VTEIYFPKITIKYIDSTNNNNAALDIHFVLRFDYLFKRAFKLFISLLIS